MAKLKPITEAEFQQQVIQLAQLRGFSVAHFRPARTSRGWRTPVQGNGRGFPDLIMCRGNRLVAAELKSATGKLTAEQSDWLVALANAGVECYVWRPSDWDEIEETLQ